MMSTKFGVKTMQQLARKMQKFKWNVDGQIDKWLFSFIYRLALVPALHAGPSQQNNKLIILQSICMSHLQ